MPYQGCRPDQGTVVLGQLPIAASASMLSMSSAVGVSPPAPRGRPFVHILLRGRRQFVGSGLEGAADP